MSIPRPRDVFPDRYRPGLFRLLVSSTVLMLAGCSLGAVERPKASQPSTSQKAPSQKPPDSLPGWKQVFWEDFGKADVPLGEFPGDAYRPKWSAGYRDGTPDTAGKEGKESGYYPSKVLSVKDGVLDWYLHSEDGVSMGAAPRPRFPNKAENPERDNSLLYGRYSVRFKADSIKGYKLAWLLWPNSDRWPQDGELDFPEGDLSESIKGAVHFRSNNPADFKLFDADATFRQWHVATTEWKPGKVEFFLDGRSIGVATKNVPKTPMHLILQTESCLPKCPKPGTEGHVQLDWIAVWTRNE